MYIFSLLHKKIRRPPARFAFYASFSRFCRQKCGARGAPQTGAPRADTLFFPRYKLSEHIERDDGERHRERRAEIARRQRRRSEHGAAEINDQKLRRARRRHDEDERPVLAEIRREIYARRPAVERAEYAAEHEHREKYCDVSVVVAVVSERDAQAL